jgi:GNAT superfamily N-acetyltransferase
MMSQIEIIQTYLRNSARRQYKAISVPPFTVFIHPGDSLPYFNYAIPDAPVGGDLGKSLAALREVFMSHDRVPRFEFVEAYAPDLAASLSVAGFAEESRTQLMVCTPPSYRPAPAVDRLTLRRITAETPLDEVVMYLTTTRRGFDPAAIPASRADAQRFLDDNNDNAAVLAYLDHEPVAAGMFTAPQDGLTELVGLATLEPYRRRGIGMAICAALTQIAFDRGVTLALLTAADERAGRVYERVGFHSVGSALAYRDSSVSHEDHIQHDS